MIKQISIPVITGFLIISTGSFLTAQTSKGSWLAEGNLGNLNVLNNNYVYTNLNYTYKSETQGFSISLFPRIGYFINDNLAIGTTLNLGYYSYRFTSYDYKGVKSHAGTSSSNTAGISPFLRYYFTKNTKNRFYVQVGGGININMFPNKSEASSYNETGVMYNSYKGSSTVQGISGEALIGFNHFFTDKVAFNSAIGYNYSQRTESSIYTSTYYGITSYPEKTKSKNLYGNVVWNFGFTIIFREKKQK
jgi:hypothetical protein